MEKEEKVEETTTPKEEEKKPEESKVVESDSKKPEEKPQDTPDYKALLEKEQKAREKAEHKIVKMKAKTLVEDEIEEESEVLDKAYLDKKLTEIKYASLENQYEAEIDKMTANSDEKALIKEHLESNDLSGTVAEQVQKAWGMANAPRLAKTAKELAHSASVQPGGENSSSYKQPTDSNEKALSSLSEKDRAYLKDRGLIDRYIKRFGK